MVEVQIAKQVSSKSDAFFHTMTSHDALMENLSQTISKVNLLRWVLILDKFFHSKIYCSEAK